MNQFESAAIRQKRHTSLGAIIIAKPASNIFLVIGVTLIAICAVVYLFFGERIRQTSASGYVVPEEGLIKVFPQQVGTISAIRVNEGQFVKQGTVMATVSFERNLSQGPMRLEIEKHLAQRKTSVNAQNGSASENFAWQIGMVSQRIVKIQQDLRTIGQSIVSHKAGLTLMRGMVASDEKLAGEGYLSKLDYQESRVRLMDQENRLHDLERQKLQSDRELISAQMEMTSLPARALETRSGSMRAADDIAVQQIENEDRRENQIIAPVDGTVTAIQGIAGKLATTDMPLLSLVPAGATLVTQLYVNSESIGFLREGKQARLQFAAFPYQKFGSYKGTVISVSRTAVPQEELAYPVFAKNGANKNELYYIVKIKPENDFVMAYEKKQALQPGMRVDAKIWVDRRTLIEWIFEPFYIMSGRTS